MKEFRNITGTGQSQVQLPYVTALNWDAAKGLCVTVALERIYAI